MNRFLHITSGDIAGQVLADSNLTGEILVWHDVLYDGTRKPGWPNEPDLRARALFLSEFTDGGLSEEVISQTLSDQYDRLNHLDAGTEIVLWFDGCLFDQTMLAHVLVCLQKEQGKRSIQVLVIDKFSGIEPYHGLGQLSPAQLAGCFSDRVEVTEKMCQFAWQVEEAFSSQDLSLLEGLAKMENVPLPQIPAATQRWLEEQPDQQSGLGRLERMILEAVGGGASSPGEIYTRVAQMETPPQFWGDISLWAKINHLAHCDPPRLALSGPKNRLPQWEGRDILPLFTVRLA